MDANSTPQSWFNAVLSLLLAGILFVLNLYRMKVDKLEERHGNLVTQDELHRYLNQMRDDRLQMHKENLERLDRIDDGMIRLHDRIDMRLKP